MESIFVFIIIAILSTVFNKDKKTKKPSRPRRATPDLQKPREEAQTGRLGDLLKEFKTDFGDVFHEKGPSQAREETKKKSVTKDPAYEVDYEYEGYQEDHPYQQYADDKGKEKEYNLNKVKKSKEKVTVGTVYENEISDKALDYDISFDRKAVIQGIIMSEVLGKPKALRK